MVRFFQQLIKVVLLVIGGAAALPLSHLLGDGHTWRILADLLLIGVFGGLYCVPLYALMQERSEESHRARIIAANNIMNALFMVAGAAAAVSLPLLFGGAALANALVAAYIFSVLPEFRQRLVLYLFAKRGE